MRCPYCGTRRRPDSAGDKNILLPDGMISIEHLRCRKCGLVYQKTVRSNIITGEQRMFVTPTKENKGYVRKRRFGRIISLFRRNR